MICLLVFPTAHTGDGWGYAADVLEFNNQWSGLLSPHHLLYLPWCNIFLPIWKGLGIDPVAGFTSMNLIFMMGTLEIVYHWVVRLGKSKETAQGILWLLLFSHGLLRFALENETYIMPLFMALLGSYMLTFKQSAALQVVIGWLLLSLSVLFHQSYVFWFAVYFFQHVKSKKYHLPLASVLFILLSYIYSAEISNATSLFSFVFHDVEAGLVETEIGIQHVVFTLINAIRTLIQIHGSQLVVWNQDFWLAILGFSGLILFIGTIVIWIKNSYSLVSHQTAKSLKQTQENSPFQSIFNDPLVWVFLLQLVFAFYSVGNAEFMVMLLPLLLILWAKHHQLSIQTSAIKLHLAAFGLGLYHCVFVIIPLFSAGSNPTEEVGTALYTASQTPFTNPSNQSNAWVFLSNNAKAVENFIEYRCRTENQTLPNSNKYIIASSQKSIKEIESYRNENSTQIITDESYFNQNPNQLNRAQLSQDPAVMEWFKTQKWKTWQPVVFDPGAIPVRLYYLAQ